MRIQENFVRFRGLVLRIIKELAPGGMADVLLCEEIPSGVKFVLKSKSITPQADAPVTSYTSFINDPNFKRFKDEVVAYVQLIHPNIVDFYGFEIVRGIPRILLAFVNGGTLADWISSGKALELKTAMRILIQLATGLQFAHEHGLIHRDLKPSNVLMKVNPSDNSFITKISDFGIVKISTDSSSRNATILSDSNVAGEHNLEAISLRNVKPNPQNVNEKISFVSGAIGTLGYGSPEQFHAISGEIDKNTDLFSFAIIATEMLSGGNIPRMYHWYESNGSIILYQVVADVNKYISNHFQLYNPNCPDELKQLMVKSLQSNPRDRWKGEKQAGGFAYFDTILKELYKIYATLFGEEYVFSDPDMVFNEDLRYNQRAETLVSLGYTENQAKGLFDKMLKVDPVDFIGWSNRSKILLNARKPEEALKAAIRAISLNSDHVLPWYNKGNALDDLGRYEEAIEAFNAAIKIDPTYSLSYYYKAKALSRLKRYDEALEAYCKAIEIDEYDINSWYDKETLLFELQLYDNALKSLEKIIEIDQYHKDAWFRKGEVLIKIDKSQDAIICFEKVIELDENSHDAWMNIGVILRKNVREIWDSTKGNLTSLQLNDVLKLLDRAKICYDKAIQIHSTDGLLYFHRAALYLERTLFDRANRNMLVEQGLEDLRKAIGFDSDFKNKAKTEAVFRLIFQDERFKELIR